MTTETIEAPEETETKQDDTGETPVPETPIGSREITDDQRAEHLREIEEAARAVDACEADWESLKLEVKAAKDAFDLAGEKLRRIIKYSNTPGPLFETNAEPIVVDMATGEVVAAPDEAWRQVKLADLTPKLSARTLKSLHEHNPPLTTHGELSDWQNAKGDWWVADIKGIGAAGWKEIEDAQFAYWTANPRASSAASPQAIPDPIALKWSGQNEDFSNFRITEHDGRFGWESTYSIGVSVKSRTGGAFPTLAQAIASGVTTMREDMASIIENKSGEPLNHATEFDRKLEGVGK